ncbi:hypothetical protein ACFOYU_11460 [Microvirga sp. GCM10011540]|uniref:hypothetical protein n=1 Tax=Microvirga sp. GCM10011540 TaxID=3317338 RepID=UPI00361DA1A1
MTILKTFGQRAKEIRDQAQAFATAAHCAAIYVDDTASGASTADYDLLQAAKFLEDSARDLRQLHARIEQTRADQTTPVLQAAE